MYKSLLTEYGMPWIFNRSLYSAKLKMLTFLPITERLFEKNVNIKHIDIFKINVSKIEVFLSNLPITDKEEIIETADKAVKGIIKAFSSIELDYGYPINWHLNPLTNFEVDKSLKWFKIPDFDSVRGDIKVVWEASRFTHFFFFTRAYMLTKDKKYYNAFSNQLDAWLDQNIYSFGPNYKCGQEATLRMINTLITYSVFKAYGMITDIDETNLKRIVEVSYKKVLSNFFYAYKCIKNNHTLSEIIGLIIGAWCSEDEIALKRAYQLMNSEIQNQFLEDGGYIQYSFNYQRFALQLMEFVLRISDTTGIELSDQSKELILKSASILFQMQDESGDVPNYGSNDGSLIFPVTMGNYRDFRPIINGIYALLIGNRLFNSGNYDEEILWFSDLNPKALPYGNIQRHSVKYSESGFYSLRHTNGHLMVVLQEFKTRPVQMDQMHIDIWYKGVNVFCDSGTYSYSSDLGKKLALTNAHNTVKLCGIEQMKKYGPFLIYDWTSTKDIDFSEIHFRGTMISKNGYTHTRVVNKILGGYSIEDHVSGKNKNYKVLFHTPCKIKINKYGIDIFHNDKLVAKMITENEFQIDESYSSLYYLNKDKIMKISILCKSNRVNKTKIILIND